MNDIRTVEARPVHRTCDPSDSSRWPAPFESWGVACPSATYLTFASQNGLRHYLKMQYQDQTFKGLYHWNLFDAAVLLPYFAVMIVLALYGVHRYTMCYLYFKYRKNYNPNPPNHFNELPRVTVQLPIFNEQFVIDRLIEAGLCDGVPSREARDTGAGRFDRRNLRGSVGHRRALCGSWPSHRLHPSHQSLRL